ncbi:hypothetical protein [Bordetella trematum]|uniref:hypothetical protein n=1 Tax=Bordetella trematum TaxID=123899 RepID=UPI000472CA1B|nr:hypothetical protein [Bordetella trematum]
MTTYIPRLAGVSLAGNFPKLGAFAAPALPFSQDLVSLHTYGLSLEASLYNYVEGEPELTVAGVPDVLPLGAICRRADCFQSAFTPQGDYTVVSVAKPRKVTGGNAGNAYLASNFGNPSGSIFVGDSCLFTVDGGVPVYANSIQVSSTAVGVRGRIDISSLDDSKWHVFVSCIGGTYSNVAVGRAGALTWGETGPASGPTPDQARALRFGGFYPWSGTAIGSQGSVELEMTAVFGRKLTEYEVQQVYSYLHEVWGPMAGLPGL